MKPKICVLFCGGTIVMDKDPVTGALNVAGGAQTILNLEPRLAESYDLEVIFIDNIDSSDATPELWNKLLNAINDNYAKYDGFVITHGTNTMGYTAAALSFGLLGIGKPVVLTGAQIPAGNLESDARRNFVNSVKLAAMDLSGVFTVFGSKIILGCRTKKDNEYSIDAFKTFNSSDFGEAGIEIRIKGNYKQRHNEPFFAHSGFKSKLLVLTLEPGITPDILDKVIESGIDGLVIRAYGAGDVPGRLFDSLKRAQEMKMPVVVTTQCPNGVTKMGLNTVGLRAFNTGVIQAFDMSMEAMTTKLHWLLAKGTPYEKITELMETDLCGEIVVTKYNKLDRK